MVIGLEILETLELMVNMVMVVEAVEQETEIMDLAFHQLSQWEEPEVEEALEVVVEEGETAVALVGQVLEFSYLSPLIP